MTIRENLSFTRKCIADAMFLGMIELQTSASRVLTPPAENSRAWKTKRFGTVGLSAIALPLLLPMAAFAAAACTSPGTNALTGLFKTVGTIIIAIGGAAFLVTLGIGALMIMASGGNSQRADAGMKWIKNSVIGVGLLAFGVFIRSIVVSIVSNSTAAIGAPGGAGGSGGAPEDLSACLNNQKYGS